MRKVSKWALTSVNVETYMDDGVFVKHIEASKLGAIILIFVCSHLSY